MISPRDDDRGRRRIATTADPRGGEYRRDPRRHLHSGAVRSEMRFGRRGERSARRRRAYGRSHAERAGKVPHAVASREIVVQKGVEEAIEIAGAGGERLLHCVTPQGEEAAA